MAGKLVSAIASALPEYTYSIPGGLFYLGDVTHSTVGYKLRKSLFWNSSALNVNLSGKVAVVVGANAGIGKSVAMGLAERGAEVHMLCRSKERGEAALKEVRSAWKGQPEGKEQTDASSKVLLHLVDVSRPKQVKEFGDRLSQQLPRIDILVNNAAIMLDKYSETEDGIETMMATNVLGFYVLTESLIPLLERSAPAKVINVVSAGMLIAKFKEQVFKATPETFNGVLAYVQHHRARVLLTKIWAERLKAKGVTVNCAHPGWVDTPGLSGATLMSGFYKLMYYSLRSTEEGADTILWLAVSEEAKKYTGEYFFDRTPRSTNLPLAQTEYSDSDEVFLRGYIDQTIQSLEVKQSAT